MGPFNEELNKQIIVITENILSKEYLHSKDGKLRSQGYRHQPISVLFSFHLLEYALWHSLSLYDHMLSFHETINLFRMQDS